MWQHGEGCGGKRRTGSCGSSSKRSVSAALCALALSGAQACSVAWHARRRCHAHAFLRAGLAAGMLVPLLPTHAAAPPHVTPPLAPPLWTFGLRLFPLCRQPQAVPQSARFSAGGESEVFDPALLLTPRPSTTNLGLSRTPSVVRARAGGVGRARGAGLSRCPWEVGRAAGR